jgi:metal-sulfur cluster biosynthetic enzyme
MPVSEESVFAALRQVNDPELLVNIVDLGLVYEVRVTERKGESDVLVKMALTTPACPAAPELIREVKDAISDLGEEVGRVHVEIVRSPPWTPDRMTDEARDQLGMY